jgi:hypothetical protein
MPGWNETERSSSATGPIRFLTSGCGFGNKVSHCPTLMYFYKAYGLKISSEIALPELSDEKPEDFYDLSIRIGSISLPKLKKTSIHRRSVRASFGQLDNNQLIIHWDGIAAFNAIGGCELIVQSYTEDPNLLSLFTVSEALGLILFQRGMFLWHASAVKVGDSAWCFMGSPGAGKSTTAAAFIKAGCQLLSDDLTAIQFDERGKACIIPAYPQLKIWDNTVNGLLYNKSDLSPVSEGVNKFSFQPKDNFAHEAVPLEQVFFIHKAMNRPAIQQLDAAEIPVRMLKNFPLPFSLLTNERLKQHFMQSFQCAQSAKMWQKRRPNGFKNLENWVEECLALNMQESK